MVQSAPAPPAQALHYALTMLPMPHGDGVMGPMAVFMFATCHAMDRAPRLTLRA
jgi:hypothetical protein